MSVWPVWALCTALILACTTLAAGSSASSQTSPSQSNPSPPLMPTAWVSRFSGEFLSGCKHSGWMYYNDTAKLLRTDWLFGPSPCVISEAEAMSFKMDVNDGNAKVIRNYIIKSGATNFSCGTIPLPNWWSPDYLRLPTTKWNGTSVVSTPMGPLECDVYYSVDVFIAGYVLTYIDRATQQFVRMVVRQGPGEDYFVDFGTTSFPGGSVGLQPAAPGEVTPDHLNVLPSLACLSK